MKELVSVIMPIYNNGKYLNESIESILNQSYENVELLLLDDGSNDNSLSIMEEYALDDKRVRIISRDNKGVSYSICDLIKYANGNYIARMDGDDVSYKNRIETQLKYMKDNSGIALVGSYIDVDITDYTNVDDKILCEKIFNFKVDEQNPEIKILNGNKICHGTFFGKSDLFKSISYSKDFKRTEDVDFILKAIKNGNKIDIIDKKLYLNRINSRFVHEQKFLDEEYNKEILISKLSFLYDKLCKKDVVIMGQSNYGDNLKELLSNTFRLSSIRIKDYMNFKNNNDNNYILILDKTNCEDIEIKLVSDGKKILKDFISL